MSNRVFCATIPKCSTHLLRACFLRLGLDHTPLEVRPERELAVQAIYQAYQDEGEARLFWGSAVPSMDDTTIERGLDRLIDDLDQLQPGTFFMGHYAYSPRLAAALREREIPVVLIARDPRAALLSMVDSVVHRGVPVKLARNVPTDAEGIAAALTVGNEAVHSLQANFDAFRGWLDEPGALAIWFEDLVGPRGGGSLTHQVATVERLVDHIGA